jgi:hypothetical protein
MVGAIGVIGWHTYSSWKAGPWDFPMPTKTLPIAVAGEKSPAPAKVAFNTDNIISKNLFDPERGAGATREAEENSRSSQRVRNVILIGTVIIGNNRTAILQDGVNSGGGQPAPPQPPQPMRLKLGDDLEGYRLAEIADKKVVFTKDAARVEVLLDYFRKVDVAAPRAAPAGQIATPGPVPGPVVTPRVLPNLPRRGRVPVPGSPTPDS